MNVSELVGRRVHELPDGPALIATDGTALSWTQLRHRIGMAAERLRDCGIVAGDRVALLAANSPDYAVTVLAAACMGAILVPLNWRLAAADLVEQLVDSGSALLLLDAVYAMQGAEAAASVKCRTAGLAELRDNHSRARAEPLPVEPDHPLGIFYTGGTTGRAKGVVLTHGNLLANARNVAEHVRYGADDVHLHVMPMFHLGDLGAFFCQLFQGGSHVFLAQFRPGAVIDCIEQRRVTSFMLAPSAIQALFADETIARRDLASWRFMWYGGSPITETALRRALALFRGEIVQGYGQTEATHTISVMSAEDHRLALARSE
ncbi:MAG: AMP-binding protein, partial [Dongiaceae bacterium]